MSIKNRFLLMGYYGQQNAGDDMMLYCILDWLKNQNVKTTVITEKCEKVTKRFRVSTIENVPLLGQWGWPKNLLNGSVPRLIAAIMKSKGLLIGGGDLIREDLGWKNLLFTLEKCILAILFKKQLVFVNMGIGLPETLIGRLLMKIVLKNVHLTIVRDIRSYQYCKKNCNKNLHLERDIVFTLPGKLMGTDIQIDRNSSKFFIVALRDKALRFRKNLFQEKNFRNFAQALDIVIETLNINCHFIPFQQNTSVDDNNMHTKIYENMNYINKCKICNWDQDFKVICSHFKNAEFVIGMRFHSLVLGLSYGKKCFAIAYDEKCYQLCESEKKVTVFSEDEYQIPELMAQRIINDFKNAEPDQITETNWNNLYVPCHYYSGN